MAGLLHGKVIADEIKESLKQELLSLGRAPVLACIRVGDNPQSRVYVNVQRKCAENLGIQYRLYELAHGSTEAEVIDQIAALNYDTSVTGIILQTPLPEQMSYRNIIRYISALKDVEGVNPRNIGWLLYGNAPLLPCTAAAVMELVRASQCSLRGVEAVVVGHSEIVGKPLALLLLAELATVSVCHIGTSEAGRLREHVEKADLLIVAAGRPGLIKGDWVKKGAVVIDVGINAVEGRIVGDVEFEAARERASFITPVPGGVGPVTVAVLMRNCIEAVKLQQ